MARPRLQPDREICDQLLSALAEAGEKSLTFGVISRRTGLAPATLSQRFGTVDGMVKAALLAEWDRLLAALIEAEEAALVSSKGAQAFLKTLPCPDVHVLALSLRDPDLVKAAAGWREKVEAALAARRGGGAKGREAAAFIFAAWQGRQLWADAGGKGFRLSDVLKAKF